MVQPLRTEDRAEFRVKEVTATHPEKRIEVVDSLRGLAALGVCWFHFTNGNPKFLPAGVLKGSGQYGWLGVEIFFVVSGFVVPYSLWRACYKPTIVNYTRFLWKRISRLDPPYLVSIALVLALAYVAALVPGYRGAPATASVADVLLHFGYLNTFFHKPWLNVVYWSLAIEFQYYILIGLLFPLLTTNRCAVRLLLLTTLTISALLVPAQGLIFRFFFLFVMGFTAFQHRIGLIGRSETLGALALALAGASITIGTMSAAVGLAASGVILFVEYRNRALSLLGQISYSLYLVHVPVGGRIINLGERIGGNLLIKIVIIGLAIAVSLLAAYVLYRWIETPCRSYSSALHFRETGATKGLARRTVGRFTHAVRSRT
jgi:peptidoglycan/LPS O-acetylase OafA/YrhL